jgi:hypothetical protein
MVTLSEVPSSKSCTQVQTSDLNSIVEFRRNASASAGNETILGFIDQVNHTYGYLTGSYEIINEY